MSRRCTTSGYTGWGVTVAVFDNGFRLLEHEALAQLNIIATYDFVDRKSQCHTGQPITRIRRTRHQLPLHCSPGTPPGNLIGPAFGANFILIRSENDSSETPVEEDYWVAGIEWADSIGVDVTSTSLGYLDYDSAVPSWTWEDMDGQTTVITRAAAMAASERHRGRQFSRERRKQHVTQHAQRSGRRGRDTRRRLGVAPTASGRHSARSVRQRTDASSLMSWRRDRASTTRARTLRQPTKTYERRHFVCMPASCRGRSTCSSRHTRLPPRR